MHEKSVGMKNHSEKNLFVSETSFRDILVNIDKIAVPFHKVMIAVLELCLASVQLPFCAPFPWLFRRAGIVFCFRAIRLYALFVVAFVGFPVLRSALAVVGVSTFHLSEFRRFPSVMICHGLPALIVCGLPVRRPFSPVFGFSPSLWGFPCF